MKLGGWVITLTSVILFLTLLGLPTGLNNVLEGFNFQIDSETGEFTGADTENSSFWNYVFGLEGLLTTLALTTAIVIGLYAKTADTNLFVIPLLTSMGQLFAGTFWSITKLVSDYGEVWATNATAMVFGLLSIGFVWACFDYFLGR